MRRKHKSSRRQRQRSSPSTVATTPQTRETPDPLRPFVLPILIAVVAVVLGVYATTLYPSVPGGDSGELIVAAHQLGVAHPPGYPLYTLLGKLFTALPFGTVAWRVHLLTALLGAAAATVLVRAVWRLTRSLAAGLLAGGLFAFSPLVWRYAVQAEVFSLNNLFAAVLLLLLVSYEAERRASTLTWFCFWFALGLTNHHTLLFVGLPLGAWMLYRARATLTARSVSRLAGSGALGLVPYLYLIVAPADHPSTTWGDTSSLAGFLGHLRREQYGTLRLGTMEEGGSLAERLGAFVAQLPTELSWPGLAFALIGVALLFVRRSGHPDDRRVVLFVSLATLALYLAVFQSLTRISLADPFWREVHGRFWQQANLIVHLPAGAGFAWLVARAGRAGRMLSIPVALALVAGQVGVHHAAQDQSENRSVSQLTSALLERLPEGSLLITKGDLYWNAVRYQQVCEGLRPDVRILDLELLKAPWMTARVERAFDDLDLPGTVYRAPSRRVPGSYDLAELLDATVGRFPVFSNALEHGDASWRQRYVRWPVGLLDRVQPAGERFDLDRWLAVTDRWIDDVRIEFPDEVPVGSWEQVAREQYREVESRRGARLLAEAVTGRLDDAHLRKTAAILERAASMRDGPTASLSLNLGIAYYLLRGKDPTAMAKMVEAWKAFLRVAPADDRQRSLVERVLLDPENAEIGLSAR